MTSILVVDDDHEMLDFLSEQLATRGFEVLVAPSGGQAIELVRSRPFDLVLCDLQMPLIDGITCMETIVHLDPSLHVLMISGEATVEKAVMAMKKGAYDLLQKPLRMEELLLKIEKALLKKQLDGVALAYEKGRSILSHLSTREWLEPAIKIMARFFKAEHACWMTVKEQTLVITGAHGLEDDAARCSMLLSGERMLRDLPKENKPRLENGALWIPLLKDERPEAVMILSRDTEEDKFSLSDLREAARFASQLLQTLDSSTLYGSFETRMQELEKTYRELEEAKDLLVQQEKLAHLGTQVANVAHEINSPLTAILGYTDLALRVGELQPAIKRSLTIVYREATKCRDMVRDLLTFARRRKPVFRWTYMQTIVTEALESMAPELQRQGVHVHVEGGQHAPGVSADSDLLRQVLINLMRNALQAMEGVTDKTIKIEIAGSDQNVRLAIVDSGAGIPDQDLKKIFNPYFSTKPEEQGSCLGLSICSEIIREHHGQISVKSTEGQGSRFTIEIPRSQPDPLGSLRRAA